MSFGVFKLSLGIIGKLSFGQNAQKYTLVLNSFSDQILTILCQRYAMPSGTWLGVVAYILPVKSQGFSNATCNNSNSDIIGPHRRGTRLRFALVQAFRVGEGFYLHGQVEDTQGKLWDGSRLPHRL